MSEPTGSVEAPGTFRWTRLADAGLTAYNHNLDTSREHYAQVVRTRTYDERLATLARVRKAGID